MKTIATLSVAALMAISTSAHGQILGGLGAGASVLPNLPHVPTLPALPAVPAIPKVLPAVPAASAASAAAANAAISGTVSKSVDVRSGSVSGSGSAQGSAAGSLNNSLVLGGRSAGGNVSGAGQAQVAGGAGAQLVGTDALSGTVSGVREQASGAVSAARGKLGAAAGAIRNRVAAVGEGASSATSTVAGSGAASAGAAASSGSSASAPGAGSTGLGGSLGLAVAANAAGELVITPGTRVFDTAGEAIGRVRQVVTDSKGMITGLLVKADDATALLPVSNFSADGSLLVSAMGEAEIEGLAERQQEATDQPAAAAH